LIFSEAPIDWLSRKEVELSKRTICPSPINPSAMKTKGLISNRTAMPIN